MKFMSGVEASAVVVEGGRSSIQNPRGKKKKRHLRRLRKKANETPQTCMLLCHWRINIKK
jgi:hypothetical protein